MTIFALPAPLLFLVANVIVVGPGPGELPQIQYAIDAAVDGDVVLVKSGTYASFVVPNRTLTIAADTGATVDVVGAIRVRNLAASRSVVVSGLRSRGFARAPTPNGADIHGAHVVNCAGPVTFQDCILEGYWSPNPCGFDPGVGARVESSAAVVFERSTLEGTRAFSGNSYASPTDPNGDGLLATSSSIALYSSFARGGQGGIACLGYAGDGGHGGDGADLSNCMVVAQDTSFSGGHGANGPQPWTFGGNGGSGLVLRGVPSTVTCYASPASGGFGGQGQSGLCGSCWDGSPGVPILDVSGSTVTVVPGIPRDLLVPAVVRENTIATVVSRGATGDLLALRVSLTAGFAVQPVWNGVATTVASTTPERFVFAGTIVTGGMLTYSMPVGTAPASAAKVVRLQSLHTATDGSRWLGDPRTLVVLDSSF